MASMFYFKMYNRIWRYASVGEILSILKAVTIGSILSYLITYIVTGYIVPISIFLRTFETILLFMGGTRFAWRMLRDNYYQRRTNQQRALIIGAGDCGTMIAKKEAAGAYSFFIPQNRFGASRINGITF
jgi:FlaA1/EpsC-like NDP-sugar epimerase